MLKDSSQFSPTVVVMATCIVDTEAGIDVRFPPLSSKNDPVFGASVLLSRKLNA